MIFGAMSGLIGSGLSFLIRLEQSGGGQVYLMGSNDQYNVIVTAHALIMSAAIYSFLFRSFGKFFFVSQKGNPQVSLDVTLITTFHYAKNQWLKLSYDLSNQEGGAGNNIQYVVIYKLQGSIYAEVNKLVTSRLIYSASYLKGLLGSIRGVYNSLKGQIVIIAFLLILRTKSHIKMQAAKDTFLNLFFKWIKNGQIRGISDVTAYDGLILIMRARSYHSRDFFFFKDNSLKDSQINIQRNSTSNVQKNYQIKFGFARRNNQGKVYPKSLTPIINKNTKFIIDFFKPFIVNSSNFIRHLFYLSLVRTFNHKFKIKSINKTLIKFPIQKTIVKNQIKDKPQSLLYNLDLHPWFVTGQIDGEGCFNINVHISKIRYEVEPNFSITMSNSSANLKQIQSLSKFFNHPQEKFINNAGYLVIKIYKIKTLLQVKEHFINYPQQSTKRFDFEIFCKVLDIVKEHLTIKEFHNILQLKSMSTQGLLYKYSEMIKHINKSVKPIFIPSKEPLNGHWVAGFVTVNGLFSLGRSSIKFRPSFRVYQHSRDFILLQRIKDVFSYGNISSQTRDEIKYFYIANTQRLQELVIPFFNIYHQNGEKLYKFNDQSKGIDKKEIKLN